MTNIKSILSTALVLGTAVAAVESAGAETRGDSLMINVGPAIGLINGDLGYGGMAAILFRVAPDVPFFVGAQGGLLHWQKAGTAFDTNIQAGLESNANTIPVQLVAQYTFEIADSSVKPYLGVAPGITFTNVSVTSSGVTANTNTVYFNGLIKPGVKLGWFYLEPAFGILNRDFIFQPTVGLSIGL